VWALLLVSVSVGFGGLGGCAGAPLHIAAMDDVERVRMGPDVKQTESLAPEAYARAERERRYAIDAKAAGDDVAAALHAERALAAYSHALVVIRRSRADAELADAQTALDETSTQAQAVEASRAQLERDAQELEKRLRIAQGRMMPAASDRAPADREAARQVATRSMTVDARLLCDAAQLVGGDAAGAGVAGLSDALTDVGKLEDRLLKGVAQAPIDDAARVRARCLDALTRSHRTTGDDADASDALLAELSASGGWTPGRDERGVVVTLHDAFQGAGLTPDATAKLKDLGRVAAAHPGFALQIVVHDANAPSAKDPTDSKRADAVTQALVAGGATAAKLKTELAGARAPVVDPSDQKARGRNERLEVVFVRTAR
jgi:hypothetical protein